MVRRLLLDLSEINNYYSVNVTDYNEKTDRRNESTHWDLEVRSKAGGHHFMVQVKSSMSNFPKLDVRHIYDWLESKIPTIVIVYLIEEAKAYWLAPQLLIAEKGWIVTSQRFLRPDRSSYQVLDKGGFVNLLSTIELLSELQKKRAISARVIPNSFGELAKHRVSFEFATVESSVALLARDMGFSVSLELMGRFNGRFIYGVFDMIRINMDLNRFTKLVFKLFRSEFEELYRNYSKQQIAPLESCIREWSFDIYRISRETKLDVSAYRNLQQIVNYQRDGDWTLSKWTHGSLWSVTSLARFYDQDAFFCQLELIMKVDSNSEVLNAATYLLRHARPSSCETLFYSIPSLLNKYEAELNPDDEKNRALSYHLRYAAMMQGDEESVDWLLDVATTKEWREPMLIFNIEHAQKDPGKFIRSMTRKAYEPGRAEKPIHELSKLILMDYKRTVE